MLVGLHVPTNFLIYRQTLTLSKCMCMRLSGASELRKFWHFYILNLLFLLIFCRYIRYTLSVQMTCLSAHMYRQISKCTDKNPKKHYWGGSCPPAPPLATLMRGAAAAPQAPIPAPAPRAPRGLYMITPTDESFLSVIVTVELSIKLRTNTGFNRLSNFKFYMIYFH